MYTQIKRDELLREFEEKVDDGFKGLDGALEINKAKQEGNVAAVKEGINAIRNLMISAIPEGIPVPKAYVYSSAMSSNGDAAITMINLSVSSRVNDPKEFHFSTTAIGDDVEKKIFVFLKSVYRSLIENEMAVENVNHINDVISQAVNEAGLGYTIRIETPLGNNGKKIAYIADDSIVFVADSNRLFSIDDMVIFRTEADELVSEEYIQMVYSKLCDAFAKAQTPAQLVAMHGGDLISLLCDISKRVKPFTLISKVYSKNIMSIRPDRDGIGYYNKDGVFAVVARDGGKLALVMSPISTATLEPVDFDVLSAVQAG